MQTRLSKPVEIRDSDLKANGLLLSEAAIETAKALAVEFAEKKKMSVVAVEATTETATPTTETDGPALGASTASAIEPICKIKPFRIPRKGGYTGRLFDDSARLPYPLLVVPDEAGQVSDIYAVYYGDKGHPADQDKPEEKKEPTIAGKGLSFKIKYAQCIHSLDSNKIGGWVVEQIQRKSAMSSMERFLEIVSFPQQCYEGVYRDDVEMAASLKAGLLWPIAIFEHQHSPNVKGQNRSSALLPFMAGGNLGEACFLLQRILKAKRNRDHAKAENLQKALLIPNFDDFNTRLRIFRDLLRCVQGIHASHHKHGDIKPENILFDKNGNVYLADYGCSSSLQKGISDVHVGTPEYMDIAGLTAAVKATEQQEYHLLDEALKQVDLYALAVTGCVLFGFLFNEMYPKHSPEGPSQGYITITRPDQSEEEILCGIDEGNPELAAYSNNWDKKGVTEEVLEALKTLLRKMVAPGKRPLAKEIANELARITAMHQSNPAPSNPDLSAQAAASTATLTAPRLG